MTVRDCLKAARQLISVREVPAGYAMVDHVFGSIEKSTPTGAEQLEALERLEAVAVPLNCRLNTLVENFDRFKVDADGVNAIRLAKIPGAEVGLWQWLQAPERRCAHVLQVLDAAIRKA